MPGPATIRANARRQWISTVAFRPAPRGDTTRFQPGKHFSCVKMPLSPCRRRLILPGGEGDDRVLEGTPDLPQEPGAASGRAAFCVLRGAADGEWDAAPGPLPDADDQDIFPRYKTMAGTSASERRAGTRTGCRWRSRSGELGIIDGGKEAIEQYGVEKFNRTCIESVFRYKQEWEQLTDVWALGGSDEAM